MFTNLERHTDAMVGRCMRKCSATLETLTLHEMRVTGECLLQVQGGQLRSLTIKRCRQLEAFRVVCCANQNPLITKFALEHNTGHGYAGVDIEQIILKMKNLLSLELRGFRFEKLAIIATLPHLIDLNLCVPSVLEVNQLVHELTLAAPSRIQRLQMYIDFVLSDAAVLGFACLHDLQDLKLIVSVPAAVVTPIYEQLTNCRRLTSFELTSSNEEDTDLAVPLLQMPHLQSLKVCLHRNAINLSAIASLEHLVWLDLHLSSCRCASYTQSTSADVNELMLLLASRNTVQELSLSLLPDIQLTPATMKACGEQFTSLQFFKYRGELAYRSFFYSLDVFTNLIEVIYVSTPTIMSRATGVEMDVDELQDMVQEMHRLRRFTIVVEQPKEMYRNARDLAESRSGLEVVVQAKEPEFKLRGVDKT